MEIVNIFIIQFLTGKTLENKKSEIKRWRMEVMKLNLGCGMDYMEGYLNCDVSKDANIDVRLDIRRLPFKSDCIDESLQVKDKE